MATLLALGAAVLHAGWNLLIKQGGDDRFLLLWGQFFLAAVLCAPIVFLGPHLFGYAGMTLSSWKWIVLSGSVHLPYCVFLAKAYNGGDFSVVYPLARGGGAVLAAIGGVLFLSDHISLLGALGIAVVAIGLLLLAGPVHGEARASVGFALVVAVTIGVYSLADAKGVRASHTSVYALATTLGTATSTTTYGLVTGKTREMQRVLQTHWRRLIPVAIASTLTYAMVQFAFKRAPVGYVTALRESSVVLAAFIGWRRLGEPVGLRRVTATAMVVGGLIILVVYR